ncbi:hypothetical protein AKJ16_DCAP18635 [Drosera capensis]
MYLELRCKFGMMYCCSSLPYDSTDDSVDGQRYISKEVARDGLGVDSGDSCGDGSVEGLHGCSSDCCADGSDDDSCYDLVADDGTFRCLFCVSSIRHAPSGFHVD